MTEAEWLACEDFRQVFRHSPELVSSYRRTKWWLACCRAGWEHLTHEQRTVVELAELISNRPLPPKVNE